MPQQFRGLDTTRGFTQSKAPSHSLSLPSHVSDVFQNPEHITGTVSHLTYSKAVPRLCQLRLLEHMRGAVP